MAAAADVATSWRIGSADASPLSTRISLNTTSRCGRLNSTTSTTAIFGDMVITWPSVGARST